MDATLAYTDAHFFSPVDGGATFHERRPSRQCDYCFPPPPEPEPPHEQMPLL
ncbi:MAG: hypothetical protein OXI18_11595 [bacterium]|nr:hypothetical protein [bacterium]